MNNRLTVQEIKPCPFCGGEAVINVIEPHSHVIINLKKDCLCNAAPKTANGHCEGYCKNRDDDEPANMCMYCERHYINVEEAEDD